MGGSKKTRPSEKAPESDTAAASHAYHPGSAYSTVSTKPLMDLNDSQKEIWLLRLPLEVPLSALHGAKCKLKHGVVVGMLGSMKDKDGERYELVADDASLSSQLFAAAPEQEGMVLKPHRIARHVSLLPALAGPSTPPPAEEPPLTPDVTPARHDPRAQVPDVEMTPRTPKTSKKRKSAEAEAGTEATPKPVKKHKEKKDGKEKSHKKEKGLKTSSKSEKKKSKKDRQ